MEKEAMFEKELRSDKYYICSCCHNKVECPGFKCPYCGADVIGTIVHESLGGVCDK